MLFCKGLMNDGACNDPDNACFNGGNCQDLPNGKSECKCLEGFAGDYCELSKYRTRPQFFSIILMVNIECY